MIIKAKIADLNVCFNHINYDFCKEAYKNYLYDFENADLRLTFNNEFKTVPSGEVIFNGGTVALIESENAIKHIVEYYPDGEIAYIVSYNSDLSQMTVAFNDTRSYCGLKMPNFELYLATFAFNMKLAQSGGIMFHSSCIDFCGDAICFSAPCGTGKSTHAKLWKDCFGDKVKFINDDKPAIKFCDGKAYAYGLPYSGKAFINTNIFSPVKAIVFIKRAEKNSIRKLQGIEAVYKILNQTIKITDDTQLFDKQAKTAEQFILSVPCYELECDMSEDAVRTCYNELYKK